MTVVFVLDTNRQPLDPCCPARARQLLKKGRASVFRRFPFTIILHDRTREDSVIHEHRLKIDPGSKTTGLAILNDSRVRWTAELTHRGQRIKDALLSRRALRRSRRQRHTRYRAPRFDNRTRPDGWLPPSLMSRVANVLTWVQRLTRLCPITALSQELVRFDTQLMQHAEITGVAYQQGELTGYEVREYLLEKWHRTCAYCQKTGVPLQIEHIIAKARGGSDRVSNLTLACVSCNQKKGTQTAVEFGFPHVQAQAKLPLKDAAAVNATRLALYHTLQGTGLPVETGTGGRTKYNRTRLGIVKSHWGDAACVGASTPDALAAAEVQPLDIRAMGHGTRQMCGTDPYGFPIRHRTTTKRQHGFSTGDIVLAHIPTGKYAGVHVGRVTVRSRPAFKVGRVEVHPKYLTLVHRSDGYAYQTTAE